MKAGYNKYKYTKNYNHSHYSPSSSKSYKRYQCEKTDKGSWRKKRKSSYHGESKQKEYHYNCDYSRENNSYSRKNNYSYKKKLKDNNQYQSKNRSINSKKESVSSNSSSSSYSDKSNLLYPYTINEIIKGTYRVNFYKF